MQYIIRDVLTEAKRRLDEAEINHHRDAEFILESVVGYKVNITDSMRISEEQYNQYFNLITRRAKHEPLDSIIGYTEFMGLSIPFNRNTLTPRQETEIMVDNIIRENSSKVNLKILDLCSGSGCIGLALKKYLNAEVTLVDIDKTTLDIARNNAKINNINVTFLESDLFENVAYKYDIIVSNPPYIPTIDCKSLEKEVIDYDPLLALDGGNTGLDIIRRISNSICNYLNDDGLFYMEFGINQADEIVEIFAKNFDIEVVKDYSGIERYIKARKKSYVK